MNGLISFWQRLVHEAGEDWTNAGNIAFDRKKWKAFVQQRHKQLLEMGRNSSGTRSETGGGKQAVRDKRRRYQLTNLFKSCRSRN